MDSKAMTLSFKMKNPGKGQKLHTKERRFTSRYEG